MANLILRKNHYTTVLMIPKDLQQTFGKTRFSQALGTGDRREAALLAAHYVTVWKAQIAKARGQSSGGLLAKLSLEWKATFDEQSKALDTAANTTQAEVLGAGLEVIQDQFHSYLAELPAQQAETLQGLVAGTRTLSSEHYEAWKNQLDLIPKTVDQMTRDVMLLVEKFPVLEEITKDGILNLLAELEQQGKGVATIKRVLCAYRNYWYYLQDARIVALDHDPFDIQRQLQGKFKRANRKKVVRQSFTPDEVVRMWSLAKSNDDDQLADLIALGAYTGARIEELCSLKLDDITADCFKIREAKTEAGNREVPIHSALRPLIDRLKAQSKDTYLLSGLTFNKYGDRSNAIGKRFGRLKTREGLDSTLVFHSFRKTLITLLEQAGIPENFCCDIVGHEKGTIGYGHYSGGASIANKKEAIEKIRYPFPIDCF
jgi:integrase